MISLHIFLACTDSFREVLPHKLGAARRLVLQRVMQYTSHMRTLVRGWMDGREIGPSAKDPSLGSLVLVPLRQLPPIASDLDCL